MTEQNASEKNAMSYCLNNLIIYTTMLAAVQALPFKIWKIIFDTNRSAIN